MRSIVYLLCSILVTGAVAAEDKSPDGPQHVIEYLTLDAALNKVFAEADSVWQVDWSPADAQRRRIERRLGWRLADSSFAIHRGVGEGVDLGCAIVGNEIGLYKPITFLVHVDGEGKVSSVQVMVFRESRGGEVRRRRFLTQYAGKSVRSPIRINRDIIGVTGATLSVRAVNAGVKKALAIVEAFRTSEAE